MTEVLDELNDAKALQIMSETEGAKILLEALKNESNSILRGLTSNFKEMSRDEIVSLLAQIKANFTILDKFEDLDNKIKILKEDGESN